MDCRSCRKALHRSQWAGGRTMKSCPRCSTEGGEEHVFHAYPEEFGTSEARVNGANPDGAQSYCAACRGVGGAPKPGMPCSAVELDR
jgi:phage FluMu protein Com